MRPAKVDREVVDEWGEGSNRGRSTHPRPQVLCVGAFPDPGRRVYGGTVTSCRILAASSLRDKAELTFLDSTQISHPPPPFLVRLFLAIRRTFRYLVSFEKQRPDAVLLFAAIGASVVEKGMMAWYARLRGSRALVFPRGGSLIDTVEHSRFARLWVRAALRGAHALLCQGPAWQRIAVEKLGFQPENTPIIPNWTATPELLAIGHARRTIADRARPVRLVFVGWVEREKGIFELLEACSALSTTNPFEIRVVGDGKALMACRRMVEEKGIGARVRFSGWLEGPELRRALADADIFVLPSWEEGLPNAMIEAMAAGLAVVVSAVGNVPDVIRDGQDGLLVPPRDVESLGETLLTVIDDPALVRHLGKNALATAQQNFGVEQAVDRILAVIA